MKFIALKNKLKKSFLLSSMLGNLIEWYDFGIYSYFMPIFAKNFFPNAEEYKTSLPIILLIFAAGFLARPIGAIIFGHLGDKIGRKKTLLISVFLITLSTSSIGLIPTYSQIGSAAPIFLLILRILQGIAVSGEGVGISIFLIESTPENKKIKASSIAMSTVYVGLLLSSIISFMTFQLDNNQLLTWGWRIPFILSLFFGLIVFFLRFFCDESLDFSAFLSRKKITKYPINDLLKYFRKEILLTIFSSSLIAVVSYLISTFFPNYLIAQYNFPANYAIILVIVPLSAIIITLIFIEKIILYFGIRRTIIGSAISICITSIPIFFFVTKNNVWYNIISLAILGVLFSPLAGVIFKILCDLYPINIRYSGLSFGYNVSMTLFGSTSPLISVMLINIGNFILPALYLMFISLLTAVSIATIL